MSLHRLAGPLRLELDEYCEFLETAPVSKQAFSKARANLNPAFVRKFADGIAEIHARDSDAPSWNGMRLIAIDGTDIALENSAELKFALGCSGPKRDAATALSSLASGPLDHAIHDCRIAPYATDERDLAKLHMERLQELGLSDNLLLFDHWYPSASFLAYTLDAGFSFVMRVREKLRDRFWRILLQDDPNVRNLMLVRLCDDIVAHPESIRLDQSPAKKPPRIKRFHMAKKTVLP